LAPFNSFFWFRHWSCPPLTESNCN
jgi:hypothetical protein